MYIKNGNKKYSCNDFNRDLVNNSTIFYLNESPEFKTDRICLYCDDDFFLNETKISDYKNLIISNLGDQYVVTLSNEDNVITETNSNIEELKSKKLKELSEKTQEEITKGFDLFVNGESKHFSLEAHDQRNISMICQYLLENEELSEYSYHADGEVVKPYSREILFEIRNKMLEFITENTERYNSLKESVNIAATETELNKINF